MYDDTEDKVFAWFFGITIGWMVLMLVWLIIGGIGSLFGLSPVEVHSEIELYALSNGSQISGSFFLGCGSVNSEPVYTFMYETDDGYLQMDHVLVSSSVIRLFAPGTDTPRIETWYRYYKLCPWYNSFHHRIIYTPEGSIWQGYDVDVRK